jgi:hypothetical protein
LWLSSREFQYPDIVGFDSNRLDFCDSHQSSVFDQISIVTLFYNRIVASLSVGIPRREKNSGVALERKNSRT